MADNNMLDLVKIATQFMSQAKQADVSLRLGQLQAKEREKERELTAQTSVLNHLITINNRQASNLYNEVNDLQDKYLETTGELYKVSDENKTSNSTDIAEQLTGNTITDLNTLLSNLQQERRNLSATKRGIQKDLRDVKITTDFYKGVGHDYKGGLDPDAWDIEDFSSDKLQDYLSKVGLEGVESKPFMEGILARQELGLHQNVTALNEVLKQQKLNNLKLENQEIINKKNKGVLDQNDYNNLRTGLNRVVGPRVRYLETNFTNTWATLESSKNTGDNKKADDLARDIALSIDGGLRYKTEESQINYGKKFLAAIRDYAGGGEADFGKNNIALLDMYQDIHNYVTLYNEYLEKGSISRPQYNQYIERLEQYIGPIDQFMNQYPIIEQTSDNMFNEPVNIAINQLTKENQAIVNNNTIYPLLTDEVLDNLADDANVIDNYSYNTENALPEDQELALGSLNILNTFTSPYKEEETMKTSAIKALERIPDDTEIKFSPRGVDDRIQRMNEVGANRFLPVTPAGVPEFTRLTKFDDSRGLTINYDTADYQSISQAQDEASTISRNLYKDDVEKGETDLSYEGYIKEQFANYLKEFKIKGIKPSDYKYFVTFENINKFGATETKRSLPEWAFKGTNRPINLYKMGIAKTLKKKYINYAQAMDEFKMYLLSKGL